MTDPIILRGDINIADTLTVSGQFDVNGNCIISTAGAISGLSTIGSSGLATLGSLSCDTAGISSDGTGNLTVVSISDGTASMTMGGLSGLTSFGVDGNIDATSLGIGTTDLEFTVDMDGAVGCGAITSTGDFSCGLGIAQATGNLSSVGTVGCGAITSTGDFSCGLGIAQATGNMTSVGTIGCSNVTSSGIVSSSQLQVNQSLTISSDAATYTQLSNGPENGTCIVQISCHTEDDANGIWLCCKTTGNAGVLQKLNSAVGNTSTYGLAGQWTDLEKPSFKYATSWGGGITDVSFKATILSF